MKETTHKKQNAPKNKQTMYEYPCWPLLLKCCFCSLTTELLSSGMSGPHPLACLPQIDENNDSVAHCTLFGKGNFTI